MPNATVGKGRFHHGAFSFAAAVAGAVADGVAGGCEVVVGEPAPLWADFSFDAIVAVFVG